MKRYVLILLFFISPIHADILGVEDAQMIAIAIKQLGELQAQYRVLLDTYQTAQSELNHLKAIKDMNSGHYGFGNLANNTTSLQSWQSPVSSWDEALHNLSGGNEARYRELVSAFEKNHANLNTHTLEHLTTADNLNNFRESKNVNRAVRVETTQSYNEINKHMEELYKLSNQIEKTPNTKAALDLNSRLITEIGFIELMSLRLQALMNQQVAQTQTDELNASADFIKFNH